ncbi:dephospho-CoA kinase [Altererythrobacter sp. KTW20L]|uniref:dephospho-CoA kinase n=1 Tax=Altererythrobacter sp. KTW20L TaxID=2942210 RepID=UPI00201C903A|nr:dephospho-CoA kinase [Altererythrobacter sp. KTW20L]MCL6249959.1 dephospho-CoA kinase [Altererythrobacter sp. KTW20L]
MKRPLIIGLTGSIGMGKSTSARMFADLGVPVFDADAEVHRLQGPDGALVEAIEAAFPGTTGPDGVRRDRLGAQVFGDPAALARLEALVHPAVQAARAQFLAEHREAPLIVFDIPLLFEKDLVHEVDRVVVVSAPAAVQRERVMARAGMTEEKFAAIRAAQMPDGEKRARAHFVIDSSGPLEQTAKTVAKLVASLKA